MSLKSLIRAWVGNQSETSNEILPEPPKNRMFDTSQFFIPSYGRDPKETPNGKLVVFGLPKSGNVWLVSLLCDYLNMESIDPMVDVDKQGIGMCHLPLDERITSRLDFIQGIYLIRDLRDIVVSYFHNCQTEWFKHAMPNFHYDELEAFYFEWFLPRVVPFHGVADHATKFSLAGLPVVRYERLHAKPIEEFSRLIARLGLPMQPKKVEEVVGKNQFEQMKKNGRQLNAFVPTTHFRRGGSGSYKEELPISVLRHLNETFRGTLFNWGYEVMESSVMHHDCSGAPQ